MQYLSPTSDFIPQIYEKDRVFIEEPSKLPYRVRVNGGRVWQEIIETASFGGIPGTDGVSRLALSESDKAIRDFFVQQAEKIGCSVRVDQIGNIFAMLPGQDNSLPPIGMGSHLDTQPKGETISIRTNAA